MKILVYWTTTERHSKEIEVDDDFDPDDIDGPLGDSGLAEIEDGDSFDECSDRYLESWEPVEEDGAPCCADPECGGNPCTFPGYAENH